MSSKWLKCIGDYIIPKGNFKTEKLFLQMACHKLEIKEAKHKDTHVLTLTRQYCQAKVEH